MLTRAWRIAIGRSLLKPRVEQHMSPSQSAHVDVQHPPKKEKKEVFFMGQNVWKAYEKLSKKNYF